MSVTPQDILKTLSALHDPDLNRDIVSLGFVKDIDIQGEEVRFTIELTTPACPVRDEMKEEAHGLVSQLPGVSKVEVKMTSQVRATAGPSKEKLIPSVRNVIPVASGKGGVGKSTVSVNLALALVQTGARVGILDADVYGPTVPTLLGIHEQPRVLGDNRIVPIEKYNLKVMSMGFFIKEGEAVVWRGPMLHKTMEQFLGGVVWGDLDYLIGDIPPGTGDVQLSLCQMIPMTGSVIVSTPQDVALQVASKAIAMFKKLNCPILGVVENMSHYLCPHCGKRDDIFGSGGAQKAALRMGLPFLGEVPLATEVRLTSDDGKPIVVSRPDSPLSHAFLQVAKNMAAQISIQNMKEELQSSLIPLEMTRANVHDVFIRWKDGHESLYPARELRLACPCAACVDEITGQRRFDPGTIPQEVHPLKISQVGHYAIAIQWSDGHSTGIYSFEKLRQLCPCCR